MNILYISGIIIVKLRVWDLIACYYKQIRA
jgi:hypothetical protein